MNETKEIIEFDFSEAENKLDLGIKFLIEKNVKPLRIDQLLQICCEENHFSDNPFKIVIKRRKTLDFLLNTFKKCYEQDFSNDGKVIAETELLPIVIKLKECFIAEVKDFTDIHRTIYVPEDYLEALLVASILYDNVDLYSFPSVVRFLHYCKKNDIFL